jgi:hypothetical protein
LHRPHGRPRPPPLKRKRHHVTSSSIPPLNGAPFALKYSGNQCLQAEALTSVVTRVPRLGAPSPGPINRPPHPNRSSHLPHLTLPLFRSLSTAIAELSLRCHFPTVTWSPHRRLSPGEARAGFPVFPSLCCAPAGELPCSGVAKCQAPMSVPLRSSAFSPRHRWSTVDRTTRPRSITRGLGPWDYPL